MNTIIVGTADGTGSGKSTFTSRLKAFFQDDVAVLYHNNYYKTQDELEFEERKKVSYDHPGALGMGLLLEQPTWLKKGKVMGCPVYDYTQHNRSKDVVVAEPKQVILLEGILALADSKPRDLPDIRIFMETDADERIPRRVIRDVEEWGRDTEGVAE